MGSVLQDKVDFQRSNLKEESYKHKESTGCGKHGNDWVIEEPWLKYRKYKEEKDDRKKSRLKTMEGLVIPTMCEVKIIFAFSTVL